MNLQFLDIETTKTNKTIKILIVLIILVFIIIIGGFAIIILNSKGIEIPFFSNNKNEQVQLVNAFILMYYKRMSYSHAGDY